MSLRNSLRLKLTLGLALFLGVLLTVSGFLLYHGFKLTLVRNIDQTLQAVASELERIVEDRAPDSWKTAIENEEEDLLAVPLFIQVLEAFPGTSQSPRIIEKSRSLSESLLPLPSLDPTGSTGNRFVYETRVEKTLSRFPIRTAVSRPIPKGSQFYLVHVGTTMKEAEQTAGNLLLILLIASPLLLVSSSFGGYVVLSRALGPVIKVVDAAQNITSDNLSHRIEGPKGKDEIGQLVETFNAMIARLEESIQQIRRFTSDVAHELKTPLTVIFSEIDVALRKERSSEEYEIIFRNLKEEAQRVKKIVENLLLLSRMESQDQLPAFETVPLDEIVLKIFEEMESPARKKDVALNISKLEPCLAKGEETLLERLLANLIDNAIKYTTSGGHVDIALMKSRGTGILSITDTGVGIPQESLPHIFDRFFQVDKIRSRGSDSTGLGLAIVKRIATAHGASIAVESQPGQGTTFTVTFPLQD